MLNQKLSILNKELLISTIFSGFSNVGFLFGAGTSYEAGFPLMKGLTDSVNLLLDVNDKQIIETALHKHNEINGTSYNIYENLPDIEILLNIIRSLKVDVSGYYSKCDKLESKIKKLICDILKNINKPDISHHLKFLNYIKYKIGANHTPFWIFTTNYDLLFELASGHCKILLENGFCGTALRYFDPDCFKRIKGHYGQQRSRHSLPFEPHKEAHLKLYKLHGSLSWYENDMDEVVEVFDASLLSDNHKETMIYPERKKLDETLNHPFDKLFTLSNEVIGNKVNYLVSCGYSYRDEHINDRLIIPKLKSGSLKIFALFEEEPDCIDLLKQYISFNYLTKDKIHINGEDYENSENDLWKFSKFVEFLTKEEI